MRVSLCDDERRKDTCVKVIGLCLQILLTTPHSSMNTIGRTYVSD